MKFWKIFIFTPSTTIFVGLDRSPDVSVDWLELGRYFDFTYEDPPGGLGPIFFSFLASHRGPKKLFLSKFSLDMSFNLDGIDSYKMVMKIVI